MFEPPKDDFKKYFGEAWNDNDWETDFSEDKAMELKKQWDALNGDQEKFLDQTDVDVDDAIVAFKKYNLM